MKIGILALQGDFREHLNIVRACGSECIEVKTGSDLEEITGLIIPGGESTTIGRLLDKTGLGERIIELSKDGLPIYGTCAGAILLANEIINREQYKLGLMDIGVERNAYGRQAESFEKEIAIDALGKEPYKCVFIRAPIIRNASSNVEVLVRNDNEIIMARQGNILVTTFHPELTKDLRVHEYFIREYCK